jgi:hypothetical protein
MPSGECTANLWYNYTQDDITITVDDDHTEEICRAGVCSPWVLFSYRIGGQSKTWWAFIPRSENNRGSAASSQLAALVKEAR